MTGGMGFFFAIFAANGLLEGSVAFALAPAKRRVEVAWFSLMMNAVTLPIAWFAVMDPYVSWLAVELAVFVGEALLFRWLAGLTVARSLSISLCANAVSLAAAVVLAAWLTARIS